MRAGYYSKGDGGKTILCVLDEAEEKTTLDFEYADELQIENPLDIMTEVKLTTRGRETRVDSCQMEFEAVPTVKNMPTLVVEWKGSLFGEKKAVTTPTKKKGASTFRPRKLRTHPSYQNLVPICRTRCEKTEEQ